MEEESDYEPDEEKREKSRELFRKRKEVEKSMNYEKCVFVVNIYIYGIFILVKSVKIPSSIFTGIFTIYKAIKIPVNIKNL